MTGIASANSIDSDGWLAGLGLGYTRDIGRFRLGANVEAFHYDVEVDGFTESNPNYALDALTLEDQNQSGSGWIAGLNIETTVMDNLEIGVGLGAIQFSDNEFDVTANVVPETTQFTVSNPGLGDTLYTADFSADYGLDDKWSVTLDAKVIGESLSDGNSRFDLGVNYKF